MAGNNKRISFLKLKRGTSLYPLLIAFCLLASTNSTHATVRYVSHSGSNTPPYTSWETAADSIMSAINISVFGDTIYVASGVYKEKIVMIPGLTLIGSGMDSCIINTKEFNHPIGFASVTLADSATFKNFQVIVANNAIASAVRSENTTGTIESSKLMDGYYGSFISGSSTTIQNCIISNCEIGIQLFNSPSLVKKNNINNVTRGIIITAFYDTYKPLVERNIITAQIQGILREYGTKPTIRNNIIYLTADFATGYQGGDNDTTWLYNNLIIAADGLAHTRGLTNTIRPTYNLNNFLIGSFGSVAINVENFNIIENNNVMNSPGGIGQGPGDDAEILKYNNSWNNGVNYGGFTPDTTNLSVDPMVVNEDTTQGELDFHLQMYSPLIDAGDPGILDVDGSRSDIGLWGGPYGERYTYRDLAPKPPSNLTAEYDSGLVKLTWNRNTEADFYRYRVYRDTAANFIYDTTKIIAVVADTFYYDDLPEKYLAKNYYYKLTAMDSTGHQSAASEEVNVAVTGIPEAPPIAVEEYKLLNNYPNPFNPSTIIPYRLKEGGHVRLTVYNLLAEKVAVLVDEYQEKGYYEVEFNPSASQRKSGKIGSGIEFPTGYNDDIATGIYIYQLIVSDSPWEIKYTGQGKMILLK